MILYLARDIPAFVMYCVNGESGSSLLIESTNSMIYSVEFHYFGSVLYALDQCMMHTQYHDLWSAPGFGLVTIASQHCVCVRVYVCVCVCAWCYCTFSVQYLYSECVC